MAHLPQTQHCVHPSPPEDNPQQEATLDPCSAYDLSSDETVVIYFYAAAGYPVRST